MLVVTWFLRVIHLNLFNFNDKKKLYLERRSKSSGMSKKAATAAVTEPFIMKK